MRTILLICAMLLSASVLAPASWAQDIAPGATPGQEAVMVPVQIDLDHAAFALEAQSSLVEFYMSFEAATLSYEATDQGFLAELPVSMMLVRSTQAAMSDSPEEPVWQDDLSLSFLMADTTGMAEGQHFVHQVRAAVPPGEYELQIRVPEDPSLDRVGVEMRRDVLVPDFSEDGLVGISDVTLASSIEQSPDRDNVFWKNGLLIRPNANQLFGSGLNTLFYYAEVYNLDQVESSNGTYTAFAYLSDANLPQPMAQYQRRTSRTLRSPDVLVGTFNIRELPSGSYFLRIAILNEDNESIAEQSRKFFVYNPAVERESQVVSLEESFETSQYARMTEEELDRMAEHVDVISTDAERRRLRSIRDQDERRRFFMQFWTVRDPNPNTPVNEYQDEFYSLIQYANDRYTNSFSEGWQTDRGRTLIRFGTPTAIDPHLFDRGFDPYEIWEYNNIPGEGQAQFIFADLDGFGSFELVHSTVTGERKSTNWLEEIRK
ncbi:MAG: GWxTD domain-containing protein [Rhodothermales bacterium]